jgi:hypothetical protein
MAYNVPIGNWSQYVAEAVNGQEVANYVIGSNGGTDPAYGCMKNFSSTYQCGNGPTKTVQITGNQEAGGQTVTFDCSAENVLCGGFRLTVGDDGNLVLTDSNSAVAWQSNTSATGLALDEFKASNGRYGRNYLMSGEILYAGEFVGSPSGNCYLMMVNDVADCTKNGLQLLYTKLNCTMNSPTDGYGSDDTSNGLYSIPSTNISTLGKVGYIDEQYKVHEYPDDMTSLAQTYTLVGNYDSPGADIQQISNASLDQCVAACNSNDDCNGFVLWGGACNLKNSGMFPAGLRVPYDNTQDLNLYVRDKTVVNDISCVKGVEPGVSAQWQLYPATSNMSMDTLCELGADTYSEQADLRVKYDELNTATDIMTNKLISIDDEKNKLGKSYNKAKKDLKKDIKDYSAVRRKLIKNNKNLENIMGMAEDTDFNMTSQNIKYFLYANLAIIIAIISIRIMRN